MAACVRRCGGRAAGEAAVAPDGHSL